MKSLLSALCSLAASAALFGQEFDVASIKVIDQKRLERECENKKWGRRGGPGTQDPERVAYECQPLQLLVLEAFGFAESESFRMPNLEATIKWNHFVNLSGIVPARTSPGEYKRLLRNLLEKRYNLKSHEEIREANVYELSVLPNGHKLKAHMESADAPQPSPNNVRSERVTDGLSALTPIPGSVVATGNRDHWRVLGSDVAIQPLAERIEGIIHAPVVDRTRLNGKFDFQLDFDPGYGNTAETGVAYPLLPSALHDQLGLSIRKTKGPLTVVIIDSIDLQPSQN